MEKRLSKKGCKSDGVNTPEIVSKCQEKPLKMPKNRIQQVYGKLLEMHGKQHWWPVTTRNKTFEIIIGAILTQNTSWKNVEKAISNLRKEGIISVSGIKNTSLKKLAELIKPAGYYNQKAERLKIAAEFFEKNKNFRERKDVEKMREELLAVKGIGPETADSLLVYAFNKPSFVVDLYTKRIFSRLGVCNFSINYEELQKIFHENLEVKSELFNEYHALLVEHAKRCCTAKPRCEECFLRRDCVCGKRLLAVGANSASQDSKVAASLASLLIVWLMRTSFRIRDCKKFI